MKQFLQRFALFSFLCIICACSQNDAGKGKTIFRYNEPQSITSLDPAQARSQANIWPVTQIFNGLVEANDSLSIVPLIAKSWKISADGKIYTFNLRNDVFFHDHPRFKGGKGRRVVAKDFVYSFKRLLSDEVASPGAWVLNDVDSLRAFESPDDTTFIVTLSRPSHTFLSLLSTPYCSVVPEEICEYYGKDFRSHPVGTGAFKFSFWKEGVKLIMLKNEHYFEFEKGRRLPYFDAVAVSSISEKQTAFMEFVQGKFDMLNSIEVSYKDEMLTKDGHLQRKYQKRFVMESGPFLNTEYLGFLIDDKLPIVQQSPLRFKKVRQAISYGFDRTKLVQFLRNNMGYPGTAGFVPPVMYGDTALPSGYSYNPEKAKTLLAEAGFPNGRNLPEITLSTIPNYEDLCEYIQRELLSIGIRLKIEINQGATHRELVSRQGLMFFRGSWIADYPEAENFFTPFYGRNFSPGGPNTTHFQSKEFDEAFESLNQSDRKTLSLTYKKMDKLILEECPVIILFYDKFVKLYQLDVKGFSTNALNIPNIKRMYKAG